MISESFHWQDALDDGSLTLQAEQLLLRLPENVVPTVCCLLMPNLINRLAETLNINMHSQFDDYAHQLFFYAKSYYQECINSYSYDEETVDRLGQEWRQFLLWLRLQVANSQHAVAETN